MLIVIYIISALLTGFVFSFFTTLLIVFGIEQTSGDPGAPIIMLIGMLCYCGILSIITAAVMATAKTKYKKEFPAKFSIILFLFMYTPFHIIGIYFTDGQLDFLVIPSVIILILSYVPFFHITAQALTNVYEFFKKRQSTT